jgi:hypothetical protein
MASRFRLNSMPLSSMLIVFVAESSKLLPEHLLSPLERLPPSPEHLLSPLGHLSPALACSRRPVGTCLLPPPCRRLPLIGSESPPIGSAQIGSEEFCSARSSFEPTSLGSGRLSLRRLGPSTASVEPARLGSVKKRRLLFSCLFYLADSSSLPLLTAR